MIFSMMQHLINAVTQPVDYALADIPPTTVIVATTGALLFWQAYQRFDQEQASYYLLSRVLKLPVINTFFKKEVGKMTRDFEAGVDRHRAGMETVVEIPWEGWSAERVLNYFSDTREIEEGQDSGCIYVKREDEEADLYGKVFALTERTNPMHDAKFPRIKLVAAEVLAMCRGLFHGGQSGHGIITGGGTFSIIEACHAYVAYSRKHGGQDRPVMIIPESAHAAFYKAAEILHARLVVIPVDPATGAVDCRQVEKAIKKWGSQVCMLVGSAPSFSYGVYDPIETLSKLALKYHIPLHVDACLGGFLAAFAEDARLPAWDFTVEGVTSLSADTHKYGGTAKGSSVLLFRNDVPYTTVYSQLDWMGGLYVTEGMSGSQAGHAAANAFAVLCHRGRQRYLKDAEEILALKDRLVEKIGQIEGLVIPYEPRLSVITFEATGDINILLVADQMKKRGWEPNVVMAPQRNPGCTDRLKRMSGFSTGSRQAIHFCLTSVHTQTKRFENHFIAALESAVQYVRNYPDQKPSGTLKVYGSVGSGLVPAVIGDELGRAYTLSQNSIRQKFLVFVPVAKKPDEQEGLRQRKLVTFDLSPTRP